jgi:hypothetical protein
MGKVCISACSFIWAFNKQSAEKYAHFYCGVLPDKEAKVWDVHMHLMLMIMCNMCNKWGQELSSLLPGALFIYILNNLGLS